MSELSDQYSMHIRILVEQMHITEKNFHEIRCRLGKIGPVCNTQVIEEKMLNPNGSLRFLLQNLMRFLEHILEWQQAIKDDLDQMNPALVLTNVSHEVTEEMVNIVEAFKKFGEVLEEGKDNDTRDVNFPNYDDLTLMQQCEALNAFIQDKSETLDSILHKLRALLLPPIKTQ